MLTTLCDCESVVNARPLNYISEDSKDLEVLTPAMFLNDIKEHGVADIDDVTKIHLKKRWRHRQQLKEDLCKRFRSEYIGQLILHSKKKKPQIVRVGDVVIVGSDNLKRFEWPLARVEKIL